MKCKKILSKATILPLLFVAYQASASDKLVEVMLESSLDDERGYCLDIAGGKGIDAPLNKGLQAHTCYHYTGGILEDQGFNAELLNKGEFKISYFDVCMTASSFTKGAALSLAKCNQSKLQAFSLKPNGELITPSAPELCVTVDSNKKKEGRGGNPVHVMRPISLELCDSSKKAYQTWSLNGM